MKKLAIFFPGIGYHCDKPLLYYARKLTQECGYEESILLSYSYDGRNICIWRTPSAGFAEQNGRNAKLNGRLAFA